MTSVTFENTPQIELVNINSIKPYENNARAHSQKQVQQIANSIDEFGFINPIIVDKSGTIIAGHGRLEALKLLRKTQVPVIKAEHLTETQIKAYRLADNKIAENAGWDEDLLKIELTELSLDTEFDIQLTGFETPELDLIFQDGEIVEDDPMDAAPEVDENNIVTKLGDVWIMGNHRLVCGDALKEKTFKILMESSIAHLIFTDPPYNVKIDGHVCGNGKIKHDEFAMATGEMDSAEFTKFLSTNMALMVKYSKSGSIHYICIDWRHVGEMTEAGLANYNEHKNICVWAKTSGGMGSLYRSQHELVFVFKNGKAKHTNNVELGKHGRNRTNLWSYAGVNNPKNQKDLEMHPTVKPVAMIADAIMDCSNRGEVVLDPFGGSGSTLIAAEKTGRKARLIELEPKYCDVTIKRWQDMTGKEAVHAESGKTFNELLNNLNK